MNFKPNKKNILFGVAGLIIGFILQLFLPSSASCPEIVGGTCQANVKKLGFDTRNRTCGTWLCFRFIIDKKR
jgi:hypothetical protein